MSKFFQSARVAYKEGKLNEAILQLQQALVFNPKDGASFHLIGIIEAQQGRFDSALRYLDSAVAIAPKQLSYAIDRANVIASLGRPAEAVEAYDKALAISPRIPEALSNKGQALRLLGRFKEAAEAFRNAIEIKPSFADAHRCLGQALWAMDQSEQAIESFTKALSLNPTDVGSLLHRAICRFNIRQHGEAIADLKELIRLVPEHAEAHGRLAMTLIEIEQFKPAYEAASRACQLAPKEFEWVAQKGKALLGLDRPGEALRVFESMRAIGAPEDTVLNYVGASYLDLHDFDKATEIYDRAIRLNPGSTQAYYNRGVSLGKQRRYREALSAYDEAIARDPSSAGAHFNCSLAILAGGDSRGFEPYEWRWKLKTGGPDPRSQPSQLPKWHGFEDIEGKSVFLTAEQGLGDTLMFCRFAPLVSARGANVKLAVPTPLVRLLSRLPGVQAVLDRATPTQLAEFHFYSPLMSLPLALGMTFENIPYGKSAYLETDPALVDRWRAILDSATDGYLKPRVGLMWSGRKTISLGVRSINLEMLLKLVDDRFDFISLQKDLPDEDLKVLSETGIHHFGKEQSDFADAAAIIELVDLVITIDTSIAHLSGGLGKETWIMLQYDAEWRWLEDRTDSPWYPKVRLFRQTTPGDWGSVLDEVKRALSERF